MARCVILFRSNTDKVTNAGLRTVFMRISGSIFGIPAVSDGIRAPPSGRRKIIAKHLSPVAGQ